MLSDLSGDFQTHTLLSLMLDVSFCLDLHLQMKQKAVDSPIGSDSHGYAQVPHDF